MKVGVVNCGVSNVGSVLNMLKRIGAQGVSIDSPEDSLTVDRLILPGVGSYDAAVRNLKTKGLFEALNHYARELKRPLLGVCLGMQLLGESSEEGVEKGLGLIPGNSLRFPSKAPDGTAIRIPQMGWNEVTRLDSNPLFDGYAQTPRFYFANSYHFVAEESQHVAAASQYGISFAAAIQWKNVRGVQFHPEKSHRFGLQLFENFLRDPS